MFTQYVCEAGQSIPKKKKTTETTKTTKHTHREEGGGEAQKKKKQTMSWVQGRVWRSEFMRAEAPSFSTTNVSLLQSSKVQSKSSTIIGRSSGNAISLSLTLSNSWRSSLNPKHKRVWLQLQNLETEGGEMNSSAAAKEEEEEDPPKF